MSKVVVARENFLAEIDGVQFDVVAGDHFEDDHPLPKKHPHLFNEPVFKFPVKDAPEPRKATAAEEKAIAATVKAEDKAEAPRKPLATTDLKSK